MASAPQKDTSPDPRDIRLEGLGVAPGVAIGPAHLRAQGTVEIPEYTLAPGDIEAEQARFKHAVTLARRQIRRIQTKTQDTRLGKDMSMLFDAYQQMLEDSRLVRGAMARIEGERINAEAALQLEMTAITAAFEAMDDAYISARVDDVREVCRRVLRSLMRNPVKPFSLIPSGSVLIADQLSPADTAQLDPNRILGASTMLGGAEGHTAILARALNLPMVLGVPDLLSRVTSGSTVIVDGTRGHVLLNPSARSLEIYKRLQEDDAKQTARLNRVAKLPALTKDGLEIRLHANVELPIELTMVQKNGATGIGLLRTEFMFMNRSEIPSEDEQFEEISTIVKAMKGKPVTVRTLDAGGDKPATAVLAGKNEDAASALGIRGIRLSLAHPEQLEAQFRASLRAAEFGPVRLLLPMVSSVSEVVQAQKILKKAAAKLKRQKKFVPDPLPPLGVMIEVPGAALASDALARKADFFAIGSNDLTMYTLATDRANEHVAHLYDALHPAVLRLIQFATQAALRARIPISICGEIAGDPRYTPLLLGLGLRELSMAAHNIPKVKQRIRDLDSAAAAHRADAIMDQIDSARIATLLDDFNALA